MAQTVKLSGFTGAEAALSELSRAVGKAVIRRALISAGQPMARVARANAPKGPDLYLSESIDVSTKLSKRQASLHRKMFKDDRAAVEVFVGAGPDPAAHNQEFGNVLHPPQPFMRPAWDAEKMPTLDRLKVEMWDEIGKAAERAARKALKARG